MLSRDDFISISLEINLFFQRIMKEHLFFIETNLQACQAAKIAKANLLKRSFEQLLAETAYYANGVVSRNTIMSKEFVTPYTLRVEKLTAKLTGVLINTELTMTELNLTYSSDYSYDDWMYNIVQDLNARSYDLLNEVITFKKKLIALQQECDIFISLYPQMLEHDIREAMYYAELLKAINKKSLPSRITCDKINFWNGIMGEHAQFIDGLLNPTEKTLKNTAGKIAEKFENLVEKCIRACEIQILQESYDTTNSIKNFKKSITKGLLECDIKSIIQPLLADHILREAYHYLRLLKAPNGYEKQSF